jgi:hypothetical protein
MVCPWIFNGLPMEIHGQTMGKPMVRANFHGQTNGNPWANHWQTMGKPLEIHGWKHGKTIGNPWEIHV